MTKSRENFRLFPLLAQKNEKKTLKKCKKSPYLRKITDTLASNANSRGCTELRSTAMILRLCSYTNSLSNFIICSTSIFGGLVKTLLNTLDSAWQYRSLVQATLAVVLCTVMSSFVPALPLYAQDVKALCDKADELFEQGKIAEAKKTLEQAKGMSPNSYEVLYRMARALVLTGDQLPEKSKQQEETYYNALYFADEAVKANPNGSAGYMRRAAANGKIALFKGVTGAKEVVNKVRDDAQKAIALNSDGPLVLAASYYILGRTHLKLTDTPKPIRMPIGLGWGNIGEALTNLKKAVDLRPDFILYNFDYARALIKDDKYAEARTVLQKIAGLRYQELGDDTRKKEAAQMLQDIQAK